MLRAVWRLPPAEIFHLSRTRNLIHIVLDMFSAERFAAIVDADRRTFDRDWSGFTVFADHLGAFRTTKASMPAMLTGVPYRNEMPFNDFLARRANVSVFHALGQQGYHLRSLSSHGSDAPDPSRPGGATAIRYSIPSPYSSHRDYLDVAAAQLLDLSLFRHAPHGVKARIYRDQEWLVHPRVAVRRQVVAERFREQTGVSRGDVESGQLRILEAGDGSLHPIEARYVSPEVHSPMKVTRPVVRPGDVDRVVLLVGEDDNKKGEANRWVRQYLRCGMTATFSSARSKGRPVPERPTCATRQPWYGGRPVRC